jgi:NTP pyrophosphatase (non-canonical NTP hydrolase)
MTDDNIPVALATHVEAQSFEDLVNTLPGLIAEHAAQLNAAYTERNALVAMLASLYPAIVTKTAIEGWDPEWHNCVYLATPTGQMSWHFHDHDAHLFAHLPQFGGVINWDGHTNVEKYERLYTLSRMVKPPRWALVDGNLLQDLSGDLTTSTLQEMTQEAGKWSVGTFGEAVFTNREERALRLLEEAAEFAQAVGIPRAKVDRLLDQVYAKPAAADPRAELNDVFSTILVAAASLGVDLAAEFSRLLIRNWENGPKIRDKQHTKVIAEGLRYPHGRFPDDDNMNGLE